MRWKTHKIFFILFLFFVFFSSTYAISCNEIIKKIHGDIIKYGWTIKRQHLDWMNLSWLQKNLGKNLRIEKISEDRIRYVWQCASKDVLTVDTNSYGTLIGIYGLYNKNREEFSINLIEKQGNDLQKTTQYQIDEEEFKEQLKVYAQQITTYNKHFHTDIHNVDQLQADMTKKIKYFSENLRQCKVGKYQYAIPGSDIFYVTSTIKGKKGELCISETYYSMMNLGYISLGYIYINCQLPPKNLQAFADTYPNIAIFNKMNNMHVVNKEKLSFKNKDCEVTGTRLLKPLLKILPIWD